MSKVIRKVVSTLNAPKPVAPYSQAIIADRTVYVSGCVGTGLDFKLVEGGVVAEARKALENLKAVLEAADSSISSVVKVTVLLVDMQDFKAVNEEYAKVFHTNPPARTCYAVKQLPLNANIEIEAIALTGDVLSA